MHPTNQIINQKQKLCASAFLHKCINRNSLYGQPLHSVVDTSIISFLSEVPTLYRICITNCNCKDGHPNVVSTAGSSIAGVLAAASLHKAAAPPRSSDRAPPGTGSDTGSAQAKTETTFHFCSLLKIWKSPPGHYSALCLFITINWQFRVAHFFAKNLPTAKGCCRHPGSPPFPCVRS